ncbi:MAG: GNAT family N-acetyltransferase [Chloroflexota bacterium]|nr:GNAT family N-acetyltransferase [Chloroflexota bacterium]MDE2900915.1 GNAT family N-acetyltransferase [Chloroflexota bacterium]MDE2968933.1 GNAT family N-acetyltransferase [Chloroflexota bacterium]
MTIPDGYSDIPSGKTVAVVTHLQMFQRPPARPERFEASWTLRKLDAPDPDWYRALFRRIGENWLWFSRLQTSDDELRGIFSNPLYEAYVFEAQGREEGLLELDFAVEGECNLSFFGLTPPMIGRGAGRWMMNRALSMAWERPIRRLWLHTCTLDHPDALAFYVRSGFTPYQRQIEVADDPRATGLLPKTAAPHVPML